MTTAEVHGIKFTDADVVNPDDFIPAGEYNPWKKRPFVLHDHGFVIAVVFADSLQDALDIAVDEDKMDRYLIDEADYGDYDVHGDEPTCAYLGNASEPFDIETLGVIELENPPFSFVALYNASKQ